MEEKQQDLNSKEELTEKVQVLEKKPNLRFREVQSPENKFIQLDTEPRLAFQKDRNQQILVTYKGKEHRIYQIKDNEIEFVSNHRVELPVKSPPDKIKASETHLRYYFKKNKLKRGPRDIPFLKEHNFDLEDEKDSRIVFECKFGIGQPKVIKPRLYEEQKTGYEGFNSWVIQGHLENQHHLTINNQCLVNASTLEDEDRYYFGEENSNDKLYLSVTSQTGPRPKRVFQFINSFKETMLYRNKQMMDRIGIRVEFLRGLKFGGYSKKFSIQSAQTDQIRTLKPVILINPQMLVVQLMDLKSRKLVMKGLVSIYELFQGLAFTDASLCKDFSIHKVGYSVELDTLVLHSQLVLVYTALIDEELRDGRFDKNQLFSLFNSQGTLRGSKFLRFKVENVMKPEVRTVTVENIPSFGNYSFEKVPQGFLFCEEVAKEVKIELKTRSFSGVDEGVQVHKISPEEEEERETQGTKGALGAIQTQIIKFKKGDEFPGSGIKKIYQIAENTLLVACSKKMLLVDIASKKVISSNEYNIGIPTFTEPILVKDQLLITLGQNRALGCLEVFKAIKGTQEGQGVEFKFLGMLDLNQFDGFFNAIEILLLTKLQEERAYELKLQVYWMESKKNILHKEHIFRLKFKLPKNSENTQQLFLETIKGEIEYKIDPSYVGMRKTVNKDQSNFIFYLAQKLLLFQMNAEKEGEDNSLAIKHGELAGFGDTTVICEPHLRNNRLYIALRAPGKPSKDPSVKPKEIDVVLLEYKGLDESGRISKPAFIKSFGLAKGANIFFVEMGDRFRAFCFTQERQEMVLDLRVLNEDLELEHHFLIEVNGLIEFESFLKIDKNSCYLSVEELNYEEVIKNPNQHHHGVPRSFILNLKNKSIREFVNHEDSPLVGVPFKLPGDRLVAFVNKIETNENLFTNAVFISDLV